MVTSVVGQGLRDRARVPNLRGGWDRADARGWRICVPSSGGGWRVAGKTPIGRIGLTPEVGGPLSRPNHVLTDVAMRTAYAWHERDEFRRLVTAYRRCAEDRAIGRMARGLGKAVETIVRLIEEGADDQVMLSAADSLIDKLLDVRNHAELGDELRRLEVRLAAEERRSEIGAVQRSEAGRPA